MQHKYFAASNSAQGFKNYYPEVFADADFVYIIKGGPGTGKSSFMKRLARHAEAEGGECEYYYCSSDPDSLDGVLIKKDGGQIGILDGTSPHVSEPRFPGAREEIINLGQFWDRGILQMQKNEIIALSEKKSAEYRNAYTYLRSVGNLRTVSDSLVSSAVDMVKLRAVAQRLISDLPNAENNADHKEKKAITDSVSMRGRVRLDTFEQNAQKICAISRFYGVEQIFLSEIYSLLKEKRVNLRVSFDPVCCDHVDGIFIEEKKIAFVPSQDNDPEMRSYLDASRDAPKIETSFINSKRFVDVNALREVRSELRYTSKLAESSLDGAIHALGKARIYHFLLEDIYGNAMNWQKLTEFQNSFKI
jgi:hypothetical protein